jgi:SAM-dependent methyltransferase
VSVLRNQPWLQALVDRTAHRRRAAIDQSDQGPTREVPAPEVQAERPATVTAQTEATEAAPTPSQPQAFDPGNFARDLRPRYLPAERSTVSRLLYDRLTDEEIAGVERLIRDTPGAWDHYEAAADESARRDVLLALGMWLDSRELIEKTGLVRAEPPEDVHAMTRGALTAAGALYEANMIVDALLGVGVDMSSARDALDFGCSSGRVVRPLAASYRGIEWHGCDPNEPAIAWAQEHLPGIDFFVSGHAPPLPFADASLDLIYAISIWSHFAPQLGIRWFEEMRRALRPQGYLVCTTHGLTSIARDATSELRTPEQSQEIADALYNKGWWYAPEFGEEGDWGVVNPDWGTAFLSPEWLLMQLCPRWRVLEFAPGRNQNNQDVYVLQRA